ncbi:MAG: hypothetical protein HZB50_01230 [Chloroflexi bacterium]|nr:hypothetical protein [Chloroflexota bacterium]
MEQQIYHQLIKASKKRSIVQSPILIVIPFIAILVLLFFWSHPSILCIRSGESWIYPVEYTDTIADGGFCSSVLKQVHDVYLDGNLEWHVFP